ncbi:MarR family transcriptional regulator [Streptomyces sp. NPDC007162]|uniref:MarR family winged helix-turn-helix transcriptional regulator n=1 Tax=Streptomyces sp. NPDC007162 TaxID=3156917 RepID=UPI0033D47766
MTESTRLPHLSSAELARRCGVTAQSMGTALRDLVERGLVRRQAHPTHGKIIEMSVTAAGVELALRAEGALEPCERDALHTFLPEEQERVRAYLQRMLGTLRLSRARRPRRAPSPPGTPSTTCAPRGRPRLLFGGREVGTAARASMTTRTVHSAGFNLGLSRSGRG